MDALLANPINLMAVTCLGLVFIAAILTGHTGRYA
jgi:hypothetical protein